MRIVLVNWARIWDGATGGGGVNGYCQALALRLAKRGHDIVSLCGGTACTTSKRGGCRIRRHADWMGLRVFEVYDSPVLAPSAAQFRDPLGEVAAPELDAEIERFFRMIEPDIVHFHNIEGFSAQCVKAARNAGARVLYSLHNYHTICPQVYLMQHHRTPCRSFDNGHACATCVETVDPAQERRARAACGFEGPKAYVPITLNPVRTHQTLGPTIRALGSELVSLVHRRTGTASSDTSGGSWKAITPDSVSGPMPMVGPDERGKAKYLLDELDPRRWPSPLDPQWQPLDNEPTPEPDSDKPPNDYARRREAMIAMLNGCDRVLAVSEFVRRKFENLGVDPKVISTLHIGTWVNEVVSRHRELVFDPPAFADDPSRPVRLVFMGFNHWYKGLAMLADTLELLTPAYLRRIDLHISSLGGETIEWRFRRMEPRLARLTFHLGYEYHDIPWICGGKDLGLVPSVWWDNGPQTVFEFNACNVPVLGARLGGIPDFVEDGVNGFLFRGNDRFDMAETLVRLLRDPTVLDRVRGRVRPPKGIDTHAAELERVYSDCISS